jgi:hypothetical protein
VPCKLPPSHPHTIQTKSLPPFLTRTRSPQRHPTQRLHLLLIPQIHRAHHPLRTHQHLPNGLAPHCRLPRSHVPLAARAAHLRARHTDRSRRPRRRQPRLARVHPPPRNPHPIPTRTSILPAHALEDLLAAGKEDAAWRAADDGLRAVSELLLDSTQGGEGGFVLGARPSGTDFFVAGALQAARTVDEGVWARYVGYAGLRQVYEACVPFMEKKD